MERFVVSNSSLVKILATQLPLLLYIFCLSGKPVERGEDRLCSTAMAVNTLLYTWMSGDHLLDHTPSKVKEVISNASLWLLRNANKAAAYNVVFSGSVKADSVSMLV